MYHASRAANVLPLLTNGSLPEEVLELKPAFEKAFSSDYRGSRLNDILGLGQSAELQVEKAPGKPKIHRDLYKLLVDYSGFPVLSGKLL